MDIMSCGFWLLEERMLFILVTILSTVASIMNSETPTRNFGLNGVRLKFVLFNNPPYGVLNFKPDGNYTFSGIGPLWQGWMAKKLNFTISYVMLNPAKTIKLNGESDFDVAMRMVENKEVDAYVNGLIATPERKAKADMTYYIWSEVYSLIVPMPQEELRLLAFIGPFQPMVWLLILITMLVMLCAMSLFSKTIMKFYGNNTNDSAATTYPPNEDRTRDHSNSYSMYILSIITNQGIYLAVGRLFSFRILVGAWLLVALVLVNSYSSTVVSYLTLPRRKPAINSLEDLAADESVGIILQTDTLVGQRILNGKSGALKILGDRARRHPENLFTDHSKASIHLAAKERCAYPWVQTFCQYFIVSQYKKDGVCRFQMSDPLPFQTAVFSLALTKNSKYTTAFDKGLMELWESGLFLFWMKNIIPQAPKCFAKTKPKLISTQKVPLGLNELSGAFLVLGIGLALSTLAYLAEKSIHFAVRLQKKRMANNI